MFVNLYGLGAVRTITPMGTTLQFPVGAEANQKALTLAVWGPWGTGLL